MDHHVERRTVHSRKMSGSGLRGVVAASVVAAVALAACGSSTHSTASTSPGKTSGAAAADIAQADRLVATGEGPAITGPSYGPVTASQAVAWTATQMPTPAALPKTHPKVDVLYGIPSGAVPYAAHVLKAIGDKLGWSMTIIPAAAQTQQAGLQAFQQALLTKPNAIIALVTPGVWVGPALAQAKKDGIVTVDVHQDQTDGPGYDAWVPDAEGIQKSLMAAFAVKLSNGKANSILFNAPGFSDANIPAAQSYLATCGGCSTQTKQLSSTDFVNPVAVQSDVTAELQAEPNANFLFWPNGSLPIEPIITAIAASANTDVKLLVDGPAPQGFQLVQSGAIPGAVETPDALLALIAIDDVSRLVQHEKPLAESALRIPIELVTKANLPDAKNYSTLTKSLLAKTNFLAPFDKAWGVSLESTVLSVSS
jgi:hypothetical protein